MQGNLERGITRILEALGLKEQVKYLVTGMQDARLAREIRRLFPGGEGAVARENRKKVLFFTVQGRPNMLPVIEGLLARGVEARGGQSTMVVCDHVLPACDLPFITNHRRLLCASCGRAGANLSRAFGLPVRFFGEFIDPGERAEAREQAGQIDFPDYFNYEFLGVNIGKHIYSAVLRYTLCGTIGEDEESRRICSDFMTAGLMMGRIAENMLNRLKPDRIAENMLNRLKPDTVVLHHGIYLTTGIFSDFARKRGIHVVVFTPAYRKNTYLFSHDATYHKTLQAETADVWESLPFGAREQKQLDEYLHSRRWGSQDFITYHPNPMEDRQKIVDELGLDPSRKTAGLFSNLVWDGQVVFFDQAFSSMLDWILQTIRYFSEHGDRQLIVRIHPAEVKGAVQTRQKLLGEIEKVFPGLPENIKIINSDSDISTYTLGELIDAALVYTTKVGLEFAVMGLPVIVAGEAFYRNKGFTSDVETAGQYFELLDRMDGLARNDPERIDRARRYAYYYFFRRFIPFSYTRNRTWNNVTGLKIDSARELGEGSDENLDLICEGILNSKPFVIS